MHGQWNLSRASLQKHFPGTLVWCDAALLPTVGGYNNIVVPVCIGYHGIYLSAKAKGR